MKRWNRLGGAALVLVIGGLLTTACGDDTAAGGDDLTQITVGSGVDPTQGLWVVAKEKGFAAEHGIDLDVRIFESGTFAVEAMAAGDVVASGGTSGFTNLNGKAKGGAYVGVLRPMSSPMLMCAAAEAGIDSPQDLVGKKVGVLLSTSSEYLLGRYAEFHKIEGFEKVPLNPADMVTALNGGRIDAYFAWQPWCDRGIELTSGSKILVVGKDDDLYPLNDVQVNFRMDFIQSQPETAQALVECLIQTSEWIRDNIDEAAGIWAKAWRGDAETYAKDAKNMVWKPTMDQSVYDAYYLVAEWMAENGLITVDDPKKLVDGYLDVSLYEKATG